MKSNLLIVFIITFLACSKDDMNTNNTGTEPIEVIQGTFEISVSPQDPNILLLDNTTVGASVFTSDWDFGKGGNFVADQPGIEEVRYDEVGSYVINLLVTNSAGFTTASKTIIVEENGICLDPFGCTTPTGNLKDSAQGFSIGMSVQSGRLEGGYNDAYIADYNNLTAEFEMKMNIMYPSQGGFNFSAADGIVDYGISNEMNIHGHALIWHNATPGWVENFTGSDAEFETMIEDYITTTLTRYSGKIRSWDVVNEAIEDGTNELRNSIFRQKMGDNYIKKCFQFARNADPDVLLFYNDYSITHDAGKQAATFAIVDDLLSENLIDGVGAQMHISYNFPSADQIQSIVTGTVSRGLKMHFSELDIRANPSNDIMSLSPERANQLKLKFKEVAEIYSAIPLENKFALTVWGLKDDESWLLDFWGVPDWPLLYNADFSKKAAYDGFLEGLQ